LVCPFISSIYLSICILAECRELRKVVNKSLSGSRPRIRNPRLLAMDPRLRRRLQEQAAKAGGDVAVDTRATQPCGEFARNLSADFGLCMCGFHKSEHAPAPENVSTNKSENVSTLAHSSLPSSAAISTGTIKMRARKELEASMSDLETFRRAMAEKQALFKDFELIDFRLQLRRLEITAAIADLDQCFEDRLTLRAAIEEYERKGIFCPDELRASEKEDELGKYREQLKHMDQTQALVGLDEVFDDHDALVRGLQAARDGDLLSSRQVRNHENQVARLAAIATLREVLREPEADIKMDARLPSALKAAEAAEAQSLPEDCEDIRLCAKGVHRHSETAKATAVATYSALIDATRDASERARLMAAVVERNQLRGLRAAAEVVERNRLSLRAAAERNRLSLRAAAEVLERNRLRALLAAAELSNHQQQMVAALEQSKDLLGEYSLNPKGAYSEKNPRTPLHNTIYGSK
jgi:hypothetical protein